MTFQDWLRASQPLLAGAVLPESFALIRDGMALAWDAAIEAALAAGEPSAIRELHSEFPKD